MSEKIVIVDYGAGNLKSAHKAVERAAKSATGSFDVSVSDKVADVQAADPARPRPLAAGRHTTGARTALIAAATVRVRVADEATDR